MTKNEKDEIELIIKKLLAELKELGNCAITGSFRDYGAHEVRIENLIKELKYV